MNYETFLIQSQVEGKDWERHRKLTTPPFNERNSGLVWVEALRQAQQMLKSWLDLGSRGSNSTAEDTMTLALHVLTCAGFGMSYSFHAGLSAPQSGHAMTYRDALSLVLQNVLIILLIPRRVLTSSFVPLRLRSIGKAIDEFKAYMIEMTGEERRSISKEDSGAGNLLSSLIRASESAKHDPDGYANRGLSDEEILGNIFIYNLAGHETTANALAYSIMLLAAYPEYQDWLAEELDSVLGEQKNIETIGYEETFLRLKRCLALMVCALIQV